MKDFKSGSVKTTRRIDLRVDQGVGEINAAAATEERQILMRPSSINKQLWCVGKKNYSTKTNLS